MATVRRLKKEIEFMSSQLIGDCIDYLDTFEDKKEVNVLSIIEEAVLLNNTMLDRACHPDGKSNPKLVKQHYRKIKIDFVKGLDQAYGKLEGLLKK
ncbi:MAG TPA: hypothetical protein VGK38_11005 [Prolixibacteraceae bacterium]|jgi:hypothetical protein